MCLALMDGRAWTAGELATATGVARSTASEHLDLLVAGGLLAQERQGRHRYLRLASPAAAQLVESLAAQAGPGTAALALNQRHLQRAVEIYAGVYRSGPATHLWHGINAAALAARAAKDGVPLPNGPDPAVLASEILATLANRGPREALPAWDLATGAEASLALGDTNGALLWLAQYVQRPDADAFELASTRRQLKEVWRLTVDAMPGALLLPILEAQLLNRQGGNVELAGREVTPTIQKIEKTEQQTHGIQLEKVLGKEGVVTLGWYRIGLDRAQAVAKVLNQVGDGFGTGFLVRGGDLVPAFGDELLLLTNAHVVSSDPAVQAQVGSLEPANATIIFEAFEAAAGQQFKIKELLFTSPPNELDASLLRLDPPVPACKLFPVAKRLPVVDGTQKVYVIGHPGGRTLSISLNDNLLLDWDDWKVHYRAPTEGGSSGSPVFNQQWDLIGLHHAGSLTMPRLKGQDGTYAANEGIWIQRIIKALADAGVGAG